MSKNNKVLFIVNPVSGVKDNKSIAQTISSELDHHKMQFDIIYTAHQGHAKNYEKQQESKIIC